MTGPVRFRVFVGGELIAEQKAVIDFADEENAGWDWLKEMAESHAGIARRADAAGLTYMIEVIWWDGEHTRFGTDVDGMVVPVEVGLSELGDAIAKRWN